MINDAGILISLLYQFFFIIILINTKAITKTANCPNSTPKLKANNIEIKLSLGKPYSVKRAAKPRPCKRPNAKTIIYLHLLGLKLTSKYKIF